MAIVIDEQRMVEDNIFNYEERIKSPLARFMDKSFTPVTYFHINNTDTTADQGFMDVAEILGENSPIRFKKIKNFPLYGIENIMIQLQDGDQGIDGSFEGEAVITPNTIKPLPNDYFVINHLNDSYVFKVTEIAYDTIMPDNYYKIQYMLDYIDKEKEEALYNQTDNDYTCILENIGSDDKCIIREDYYDRLIEIDKMYSDMVNTYNTFYYNERYNCLLGDFLGNYKLYDPLQTVFINKNKLFNKKKNLQTIILTEQFDDPRRKIKYEKSIYRCVERRDPSLLSEFNYTVFNGVNNPETSFKRWYDERVKILDTPKLMDPNNKYSIFTLEALNTIKMNAPTDNKYMILLQKYFNKDYELNLNDIDTSLNEELVTLDDANLEVFFFTPILLYIIKYTVDTFMKHTEI